MDLLEYQGKELLRLAGLAVPRGRVAANAEEAAIIATELASRVAVKAQVRIGGRGKAGGIKLADDPETARTAAEAILGMDIRGHRVRQVLVEEVSMIRRELYAAVVFDRAEKKILLMLSGEGGVDIEELAASRPEAIARVHADPLLGWSDFLGRRLAFQVGLDSTLVRPVTALLAQLYQAFQQYEATLVEINPLILTDDGRLVCLDAKVSIDNNALHRHPEMAAYEETEAEDPQERMAKDRGVIYVKLDGDIGILGNGAGLVMSTLDLVQGAGGRPANFCDVGGGASQEEIVGALEVLTSDQKVNVILFNIFGGITRCDEVARGVLAAIEQMGLILPIVVRLDGTNEEEGRRIIAEADKPNIHVAATMLEAARMSVDLVA